MPGRLETGRRRDAPAGNQQLYDGDVFRLGAFLTLGDGELDLLAFEQGLEA